MIAPTVLPTLSARRLLVTADDDDVRHKIADALWADGFDVVQMSVDGRCLVTVASELAARPGAASIGLVV